MKTILKAKSSSGGAYDVEFQVTDGFVRVFCHCQAGVLRQMCKHKLALIKGEATMLFDETQAALLEGIRKGVVHTESPPWLCGWHTYLPSFSEQIFKSAAQVGTPLPHRHPLFG